MNCRFKESPLRLITMLLLGLAAPAYATDTQRLYTTIKAHYDAERYDALIAAFEAHRGTGADATAASYYHGARYYYAITLETTQRLCAANIEYGRILESTASNTIKARVGRRKLSLGKHLRGKITVECVERGTFEIRVGDQAKTACNVTFEDVKPGNITLGAWAGGIELAQETTEVEACSHVTLSLPGWATVRWRSAPINADVFRGKSRLGRADAEHALPVGTHALTVQGPGLVPRPYSVSLKAGDRKALQFEALDQSNRLWPWLAVGASTALAGVGGYFFTQHLDDADAHASARSAYQAETASLHRAGALRRDALRAEEQADTSANRAMVLGGIGAVGLIGSLIWLMSGDKAPTAITPTGNGIQGRF